jgi:hypothetical protein
MYEAVAAGGKAALIMYAIHSIIYPHTLSNDGMN